MSVCASASGLGSQLQRVLRARWSLARSHGRQQPGRPLLDPDNLPSYYGDLRGYVETYGLVEPDSIYLLVFNSARIVLMLVAGRGIKQDHRCGKLPHGLSCSGSQSASSVTNSTCIVRFNQLTW